MKRITVTLGLLILSLGLSAQDNQGKQVDLDKLTASERTRYETLRYGTESEIIDLVKSLKNEKNETMDDELVSLVKSTKNGIILSEVFTFFGDREKPGLEERAIEAIANRDEETNQTVMAAVNYVGNIKAPGATDILMDVINSNDQRYTGAAFRALGKCGAGKDSAPDIAKYLIEYYENHETSDDNRREIIVSLGELKSTEGVDFLISIAGNNDERVTRRMSAVTSLSKIGDPRGVKTIISCVSSPDPNLRATAVGALGPFTGDEVDKAIIEAFRDSYYRTRIAAAQAAGERKLEAAVPFLKFRAERDDVPNVKDEAIKALGSIGNNESFSILETLFLERKNSDRVRIVAGEMLIKYKSGTYAEKFIVELDDAKKRNQNALYNNLSRIIATADTSKVSGLAARFLDSGGVVERSNAMDMMVKNNLRELADKVQPFTDEKKYGTLARKARSTLEKMGIPIKEPEEKQEPETKKE